MIGGQPQATALTAAIDARLPPDQWGGVQEVVAGLAAGFATIEGHDSYLFLTSGAAATWLQEIVAGPASVVVVGNTTGRTVARRLFDGLSRSSAATRLAVSALGRLPVSQRLPRSDGRLEALRPDVVHFTTPQAYLTGIPSIYQPHDLLHVHHPELLGRSRVQYRERAYRVFAHRAAYVVAMTEWGRGDLCAHLDIPPSRVAVVPWAPSVQLAGVPTTHPDAGATIPQPFLLYPAQTWPHKNHRGLIDAVALLRGRGVDVRVACTGRRNEWFDAIQRHARRRGVADLVRFVGYVPAQELRALYDSASGLIFPSRFEGWGLPVVEAFALGLPVACSSVTALPEVAGDAALLFEPDDVEAIAEAMQRLLLDDTVRATLIERGRERARRLSWTRTARTFRALYRVMAERPLSNDDARLLAPPTLPA